ncbi:MAG: hypothetical protein ACK5LV_07810 [Lachnospirales bacterium]
MLSAILTVTVSFSSLAPIMASDFVEEDVTILDLYNKVDVVDQMFDEMGFTD